MTTSRRTTILQTLRQINARLDQQAAEIASISAALDVHFDRIACLQADYVLPVDRLERRKMARALLQPSARLDKTGSGNPRRVTTQLAKSR